MIPKWGPILVGPVTGSIGSVVLALPYLYSMDNRPRREITSDLVLRTSLFGALQPLEVLMY